MNTPPSWTKDGIEWILEVLHVPPLSDPETGEILVAGPTLVWTGRAEGEEPRVLSQSLEDFHQNGAMVDAPAEILEDLRRRYPASG